MAIHKQVDALSAKVDRLGGAAPAAAPRSPPAAPPAPAPPTATAPSAGEVDGAGWDGSVDETAYFDESDEDDRPDWRDVRKLKRLL